jgi:hypothetical protein
MAIDQQEYSINAGKDHKSFSEPSKFPVLLREKGWSDGSKVVISMDRVRAPSFLQLCYIIQLLHHEHAP